MWYTPLKNDLDAFIAASQDVCNADYRVKLYKGNIVIAHRASETSLFSPEIRSIKATGFDQRWCSNAAKVRGLPFEILSKRRKAMEKFLQSSGAKRPSRKPKSKQTRPHAGPRNSNGQSPQEVARSAFKRAKSPEFEFPPLRW